MAWTDEMVEGLKKMWSEGLTTNEIAKNLGVSKNSIVGKVHRLNLTARPSPIKKKEEENETEVRSDKKAKAKTAVKPVKITINSFEMSAAGSEQKAAKHHKGCIKLTELGSHTCRWPMGDPRDDNFCFCGKKVRGGQTYCEEHAAIAYVKPTKKA